ncbi:hypothetical protein Tco_0874140 [Tanacetum coccineum]|uniref:Uncharacterized protein n=1 Tax=Tanacetum coccineum TaxID=301880 RepID=A0ABQ5BPY8_9ASTR
MTKKCIWFRLCGKEHVYTLPEFTVLLGLYSESEVQHRLFETHFLRLMTNDKGFNHDAYWNRIGQPTNGNKKLAYIRYPLLHIMHKILVGAFVHRTGSRDKVQKLDLSLLSLLDEGHNANVAWILAGYLSKKASGLKKKSEIYGGRFVTKIAKKLGFYNDKELAKCSKPIKNWNASLNDIKRRDVWRDAKLLRNGYMLKHSIPILHHLADEANFAYPTYEPPNVLPYPYPYVPYPHPYTHYPDMGNPSYEGGQYGAPGHAYLFTGAMPSYRGNSIVSSSGYEIRGSSKGVQDNDDDDMSDQFVRSEDCVESDDDMDD